MYISRLYVYCVYLTSGHILLVLAFLYFIVMKVMNLFNVLEPLGNFVSIFYD